MAGWLDGRASLCLVPISHLWKILISSAGFSFTPTCPPWPVAVLLKPHPCKVICSSCSLLSHTTPPTCHCLFFARHRTGDLGIKIRQVEEDEAIAF